MDFKTEFFKFAKDALVEAEAVLTDIRTESLPGLVVEAYVALDKVTAKVVDLQQKVDAQLN